MQRQLAQQRLQEQARDMAMRFEQQKQLTQIRQMQAYGYPQVGGVGEVCFQHLECTSVSVWLLVTSVIGLFLWSYC